MKKCILLLNFYIFAYLMLNPAGFGKIYKRTQQEEVRGGEGRGGEETTIGPPKKYLFHWAENNENKHIFFQD